MLVTSNTLFNFQFMIINFQIPHSFDAKNYSNLHEAFKLLGKPMIDHLHLNFISTIHTSAFNVLREHVERNPDDKQKPMFEEICEVCEPSHLSVSLIQPS